MSEINELKEQLAEMQQRINELEHEQMEQPIQRRNMLKAVAGVAAGAAVGGLGFARPAAAADGDSFSIGDETNIADSATLLVSNDPFTLGGQGGIFGVTDNGLNGAAKLFDGDAGFSDDFATDVGEAMVDSALSGGAAKEDVNIGVTGVGDRGVHAYGVTDGLRAFGGAYGGAFQGGSAGLVAQPSDESTGVGAKLMGEVPLKLVEGGEDLPSEAGNGHFRFTGGDLYFGTSTGWKNLTNPASSGATSTVTGVFVPVTPFRVYDSRKVSGGRLSKGDNVVVDCSDARADDHSISTVDALPPGATAIAYNLTATGTGGAGFLSVAPGDVASTTVSTINWSSANIDIANSSIVKVDGNRQVKVFCDGYPGAASDFIMDIVGYYQ